MSSSSDPTTGQTPISSGPPSAPANRWKSALFFLAWALGGLALFAYFVVSMSNSCLPEKNGAEIHGKAEGQQTQTARDRRSSISNFSFSFQLSKAEDQKGKAEDAEGSNEKPHEAWWKKFFCDLKVSDVAIAYFTYCLVLVGVFQGLYLRKSIDDTGMAAEAARTGVEIAQAEFRISHPPKLEVSRFQIIGEGGTLEEIRFVIRNVGHTSARVFNVAATLTKPESDGLPPTTLKAMTTEGVDYVLAPGEGRMHPWKLTEEWLEKANFIFGFERGGRESGGLSRDDYSKLLFVGYVNYLETPSTELVETVVHQTGFLRRFSMETMRFVIVNDPDYEYQN